MSLDLTFARLDPNNCRAYYTSPGRLYCIQDETCFDRPDFVFYRCTSDGEPFYPAHPPFADLAAEYAARTAEGAAAHG